jgi:hypothetical protein
MEFGKDLHGELFLVNSEEFLIFLPANITTQEPLGVTSISDSKFFLDLDGYKV